MQNYTLYVESSLIEVILDDINICDLQNDFNTEGINNKSDALLALVQSLKAENLIDGVGFQSHFIIGELPTDLQANLQRFVDAGVEVAITELDIRTELPLTSALETQQSIDYTTVINACQAVEKCVGVVSILTFWNSQVQPKFCLIRQPGESLICILGFRARSLVRAGLFCGMVSLLSSVIQHNSNERYYPSTDSYNEKPSFQAALSALQ